MKVAADGTRSTRPAARGRQLRLVAVPREPHPYQESVYRPLRALGHEVAYAGALTPSRSLNLLLMPLELVARRACGFSVLHIHWVFGFRLPGSQRLPPMRMLAQAWYALVLWVAQQLHMCVVWTAHNVLPHEQVFHDDVAARRTLVEAADLVIAHSHTALAGLEERIGVRPRHTLVVPLGPSAPFAHVDATTLRSPRSESGPLHLLFLGRVSEYKGVDDLLVAAHSVAPAAPLALAVVGLCGDSQLAVRLRALAEPLGEAVELRLEQVSDDEVTRLMAWADVVVLPYRRLTTSSSVFDAMIHGRPVVVPDLPAFKSLPDDVVIRYDGSVSGLTSTLSDLSRWDGDRLRALGASASTYSASFTWEHAVEQMLAAVEDSCRTSRPGRRG